MAEETYTKLGLEADRREDQGAVIFYAVVDGARIPIATVGLGKFDKYVAAAADAKATK